MQRQHEVITRGSGWICPGGHGVTNDTLIVCYYQMMHVHCYVGARVATYYTAYLQLNTESKISE